MNITIPKVIDQIKWFNSEAALDKTKDTKMNLVKDKQRDRN